MHRPSGLWMLDDSTPFQDYSGNNRSATQTGSASSSIPVVSGALFSTTFGSAKIATFTPGTFLQGKEMKPFTLAAWVLPIPKTTTGVQAILSHTGVYDGLTINGKTIAFVTKYSDGSESRCEYILPHYAKVFVVGVHTNTQNQLWINGVQVASSDVTDDQSYLNYSSSATTLVSGQSASDQQFAGNAFAVYAHSLNERSIKEQYREGIRTAGTENHAPSQKGEAVPLGANSIFLETTWDDNNDWNSGIISSLAVADNMLLPDVDANLVSLPGTWLNSVALDVAGDTTIYGAHLSWDGQRVTVETSLDGQTWFTAANGQKLQSIPQGTVTSGVDVEIRVSFAGGYSDGSEYLSSLTFTGYTDSTTVSNTRTVTIEGSAALRPAGDVFELRDDEGILLDGGRVVISADSADDAIQVKTLEVWAKSIGSSNFSLSSPSCHDLC